MGREQSLRRGQPAPRERLQTRTEGREWGARGRTALCSSLPQEVNTEKLTAFVNTLNGKDGTGSHLVTVPPGPSLADALISSPILAGEGGAMLGLGASDFEFGVDPSADPELALVSKR